MHYIVEASVKLEDRESLGQVWQLLCEADKWCQGLALSEGECETLVTGHWTLGTRH